MTKVVFRFKYFIGMVLILSSFSGQATDYNQTDPALPFSDNTAYTNINLTNTNTIGDGQAIFTGLVTGDININNSGSITSSNSFDGVLSLLTIGNLSGTSTVNITNTGSLTTTGTFGTTIYIVAKLDTTPVFMRRSYNIQVNNSGTIVSNYISLNLINGNSGTFEITNSGTIDSSSYSGTDPIINLTGNHAIITNSGNIVANSSSNTAINVSSGLTLNILDGSNITGKVIAGGSDNILNIKKNVNLTEYNGLVSQLVGNWTTNMTSGATLTIANGETLASTSLSGNGTISNSGTLSALSVSGTGNTLNLVSGSSTGDIANTGSITVATGSDNVDYSGNISGNGALIKTGSGRLELTAANDYTGTTTVSAGELKVNANLSSSSVILASGADLANNGVVLSASLSGNSTITNNGNLGALSSSGSDNSLIMALNSLIGDITNSGSLLILPDSSISYSGTISASVGDISNTGSLSISSGALNLSYARDISGSGSVIKIGSGRLELTGTNDYTGTTTISAGELKVNGSLSSSAVTVDSGAKISGHGTVGGLTVQSGGTLAAGNSIGTLNVSGDLNLNSGSITDFEFNNSAIDKIIATGNITVHGIANFALLGADGYFTVTQNVLETTGGAVSGQFDTVTTDNGFSTSLKYNSASVEATISKTLNGNALDGTLSSQNSVARLLSKSLTDQLRDSHDLDSKKTSTWVSVGSFNSTMSPHANSSGYASDGYITSAGLVNNYNNFEIVGGVFNSEARVNRFIYDGKDDIDTSGLAIGLGKNFATPFGDLYGFTQVGLGFFNFYNDRYVNVNGDNEIGKGSGSGNFQYLDIGLSHTIPVTLSGKLELFASENLQKTHHKGWHEYGLSAGNLDISDSSISTANFEIGASYKDNLAKFLHLPQGSFYKLEVTGYQSNLYSKKNALVTESTTSYSLTPTYSQKFILGSSAYFAVPFSDKSVITAKFDKRQNGDFREFIGSLGYNYNF